jgi:hypothetical protein
MLLKFLLLRVPYAYAPTFGPCRVHSRHHGPTLNRSSTRLWCRCVSLLHRTSAQRRNFELISEIYMRTRLGFHAASCIHVQWHTYVPAVSVGFLQTRKANRHTEESDHVRQLAYLKLCMELNVSLYHEINCCRFRQVPVIIPLRRATALVQGFNSRSQGVTVTSRPYPTLPCFFVSSNEELLFWSSGSKISRL